MKVTVFDIKRYAINDGPGIRTTLFFKGCPLRCVWCHNPESWLPQPELLFKAKKCIGCNCCGIHPHQMEYIGKGIPSVVEASLCPTLALEQCGREYDINELLAEVEKERDIMLDSGGGVTISGGEPLIQAEALIHILSDCRKRGFHRCVDTTLYASPEVVRAVAAEADLFLVDLKVMNMERHKQLTGVSNERILSNLRLLSSLNTPFQIRIPLIEGINADEENIEATASLISTLSTQYSPPVALLPYHDAGKDKHTRRGTTYNPYGLVMSTPSDATIHRCITQFDAHEIEATVGGG